MKVISIRDLDLHSTLKFLRLSRRKLFPKERLDKEQEETIGREIWKLVGGRLSYLNQIVRHEDMLKYCNELFNREKEWILSKVGLIVDCDDDV
jgi:AAA+ ATPase superfamily predicted ATPase